MRSRTVVWLKALPHVAAAATLIGLILAKQLDWLGPDPLGQLTRLTGRVAIAFLLASLVPTAVRILSGSRVLMPIRRDLGLYSFKYALLHFLIFAGLDYRFDLELLFDALRQGSRNIIGAVSWLILLVLALTSSKPAIRLLGRHWRPVHRLTYLASALAVAHYVLTFKEWRVAPIVTGAVLVVLLALRLVPLLRHASRRTETA
jgi:sulfoxide reductase heme-binding subunit YedZ